MIKIRSIFPTNPREIELVKFINRYQYLSIKDAEYFFEDTYYTKRITRLLKNMILRKYKKYLVLGCNGQDFIKVLGEEYNPLQYQKKYTERLKYLSHLEAIYKKNKNVTFTPSFNIKDKTAFTENSRKYIGILNLFGTKYLTYRISSEHTRKYINSIIYDIQKETQYTNIIILVNDIKRINFKDFVFGLNSVIICEDTEENLKDLQYLQQINWSKIIDNTYHNQVHISEYNFCNYTDNKEKYITTFYFIDTEKLNKIDMFLQNNPDKQAEIICSEKILKLLRSRNTVSQL